MIAVVLLGVDWPQHLAELKTTAAVLAAVAVIGRMAVVPVWRFFKRMERAFTYVEAQFQNNGGSAAADKWDRTEGKVDLLVEQLGVELPPHLRTPLKKEHS